MPCGKRDATVISSSFPNWVGNSIGAQAGGGVLVAAGAVLIVSSGVAMGRSLAVGPRPPAGGTLVTHGPYRLVRHPIYLGAILFFAGGSLLFNWAGLLLTAGLAVLWATQARAEERYLIDTFPEYAAYRSRVRYRLVPFLY